MHSGYGPKVDGRSNINLLIRYVIPVQICTALFEFGDDSH